MPIRVLIVDDSVTQRRLISAALAADARIHVVGTAADPIEARAMIKTLQPDVLTLDIDMPNLDGMEFLNRIMKLRPMPVVILSGLSAAGSPLALEAMSRGARDCVAKSVAAFASGPGGLAERVVGAASSGPKAPRNPVERPYRWNGRIVVIGASTGGIDALERIFRGYPENAPPTLVAQHLPAMYLERFQRRLDRVVAPRVRLAEDGMAVAAGHIYLAPGGDRHLALSASCPPSLGLVARRPEDNHCPSVSRLFTSACAHAPHIVAVMLTGMGRDGVDAMHDLRRAGADCLAQDQQSSVVFGMPGAALAEGAAARALPPEALCTEILMLTNACNANANAGPMPGFEAGQNSITSPVSDDSA